MIFAFPLDIVCTVGLAGETNDLTWKQVLWETS